MRTIVVGHPLSVTPMVFYCIFIHGLRKRNNAVDEKCSLFPISCVVYYVFPIVRRPSTDVAVVVAFII